MALESFRLENYVVVQFMASKFGCINCLNFRRLIWRLRTCERPSFFCSKNAGELIVIQASALGTYNLRKILIHIFQSSGEIIAIKSAAL
jgi:hypothetical protein